MAKIMSTENKPTVEQIMRLHRLQAQVYYCGEELPKNEIEELNNLEQEFGMFDHTEILNDTIQQLKEYINNCISRTLHDARVSQLDSENEQLKADLRTSDLNRQSLWADSVKMADELNFIKAKHTEEIQQLKSKLEVAKKGLEFYANGKNWQNFDLEHEADPDCEADYEHLNPERPRLITGGKKARQALKEISEG
jgi:hypothetical protein